jgi:hypothetical protein
MHKRVKEQEVKPSCFSPSQTSFNKCLGSSHPQTFAENDCFECSWLERDVLLREDRDFITCSICIHVDSLEGKVHCTPCLLHYVNEGKKIFFKKREVVCETR